MTLFHINGIDLVVFSFLRALPTTRYLSEVEGRGEIIFFAFRGKLFFAAKY